MNKEEMSEVLDTFDVELLALSRLRSPHIVQVCAVLDYLAFLPEQGLRVAQHQLVNESTACEFFIVYAPLCFPRRTF